MRAKFVYEGIGKFFGGDSDFEKLKATYKAIRTMSKEDQDYIDKNVPNHRQDIGELDNLVDTYNRVYGTKMNLAIDHENGEIIIDNIWSNSLSGVKKKVLKPLGLSPFWGGYDEGEQSLPFTGWDWYI